MKSSTHFDPDQKSLHETSAPSAQDHASPPKPDAISTPIEGGENAKIRISKSRYNWLTRASLDWVHEELISPDSRMALLERYDTDSRGQFIRSLILIGALLIGAGILSFIASNWPYMTKPLKMSIIMTALLAANFTGYKLRLTYPKTARGFFLLGALIYGAGIFLIGQMFHFSSDYPMAFLLWAAGILPIALMLEDLLLMLVAMLMLLIHIIGYYGQNEQVAYWVYPILAALFYYEYRKPKAPLFLALCLTTVALTWSTLQFWDVEALYIALVYVAIGGAMVIYYPLRSAGHLSGTLLYGIAGLIASIQELWHIGGNSYEVGAILFSIAFGAFLLWQIRKGVLLGIVLACALIFRYYMDLTYNFMPKSMFFILGGLILLGFGFWFERERRKGDGHDEKNSR